MISSSLFLHHLKCSSCFSSSQEFKVPALAGLVMQTQGYGHGETHLQGVIQLTASRLRHNAPMLEGLGAFENKLAKEAAQPRYVSVRAIELFRALFPRSDLERAQRDPAEGFVTSFPPVLPGILLGTVPGLCAGFRSEIPAFHPQDALRCVHLALHRMWREEARARDYGSLWAEEELHQLGMGDWEQEEDIVPRYRDCPGTLTPALVAPLFS